MEVCAHCAELHRIGLISCNPFMFTLDAWGRCHRCKMTTEEATASQRIRALRLATL